jgi:hypothetical protein
VETEANVVGVPILDHFANAKMSYSGTEKIAALS